MVLQRDRKHFAAPRALHCSMLVLQRCPLAATRTDRIPRPPAEREIHGIIGAGDDRPLARANRVDLHRGPGDGERLSMDIQQGRVRCQANDLVPGAATHPHVDVTDNPGPRPNFYGRPLGELP
jgi:hypothetical protein